jgi:hypothetical protein
MKMNKIALAGLATAALVFAPSAPADVPGLAPFVGSWHAHEEGLDIQPNGNGPRDVCRQIDLSRCTGDTATGAITAASNPKDPIGGPVTIKLVGGGQGLQLWTAGGDQGFPFCNSNDASHYYCGA